MPTPKKLSHIDGRGVACMVDVSGKTPTLRRAVAEGCVVMAPATLRVLLAGAGPKGEVLGVARIAGIMAAKRCGELIPLSHPLPLEQVTVDVQTKRRTGSSVREARVWIRATATITAKTGVEMEALTAVSVAALTIIDMLKAIDQTMRIDGIRVLEKSGGKPHARH